MSWRVNNAMTSRLYSLSDAGEQYTIFMSLRWPRFGHSQVIATGMEKRGRQGSQVGMPPRSRLCQYIQNLFFSQLNDLCVAGIRAIRGRRLTQQSRRDVPVLPAVRDHRDCFLI